MCAVEQFSSKVLLQLTEVLKAMNDLYEEFASDGWECLIMHACSKLHSTSFITRRQGTSTKIRYVPYCETTLNIFTALREGVMAG